mmetsp:Transcript_29563/g.95316  ORF Transcript_29563/g.95316 Transcript_29563/m.95316 type:complete len:222 (+) Transcript_29563:420-1085(+)
MGGIEEAGREEEEDALGVEVGLPALLEFEPAGGVASNFREEDAQGLLGEGAEAEAVTEVSEDRSPEEEVLVPEGPRRRGDPGAGAVQAVKERPEDASSDEALQGVGFRREALQVSAAAGAVNVPEERQDLVAEPAARAPLGRRVLEVGHAEFFGDLVDVRLVVRQKRPRDADAVEDVLEGHAAQLQDARPSESVRQAVLLDVAAVVPEEHRASCRRCCCCC